MKNEKEDLKFKVEVKHKEIIYFEITGEILCQHPGCKGRVRGGWCRTTNGEGKLMATCDMCNRIHFLTFHPEIKIIDFSKGE
jgi:RecJ-like exonuclease